MFFLLYRHTDEGVFDDFRKFSKIFQKARKTFPNIFRKFQKVAKTFEDPKMFRSYTNEIKYSLRDNLDISEIIDIFISEDMNTTPLVS